MKTILLSLESLENYRVKMTKRAQYLGFKKSQKTEKRINVPLTFDGIQRTHTET